MLIRMLSVMALLLSLAGGQQAVAAATADREQRQQVRERFMQDAREVLTLLDRWASAWVNLDLPTYITCYTEQYRSGQYDSHEAWLRARKHRFASTGHVELGIKNIEVLILANGRLAARFRQEYKSDSYQDVTHKLMTFVREGSEWRIHSEDTIQNLSGQ